MIGLWQIVTVAFLVGLGVTAPAAMRPWMHAAGGVIVLAAIAPATVVLLIVLTAIVLTATSSRGPVAVALVVVIGSFLGYRTRSPSMWQSTGSSSWVLRSPSLGAST